MCGDCGHEFAAGSDQYRNYIVGVVVSVEEVKKKKLKVVSVDVGAGEPINVVTSAKHVAVDERVVVALEGARVPATATQEECEDSDEEEAVVVQAASVGGRKSHGSTRLLFCSRVGSGQRNRSHSLMPSARPLSHAPAPRT
jgi:tRNA-binding EMAP/Myf-like protein